jgi:hypothetical protein
VTGGQVSVASSQGRAPRQADLKRISEETRTKPFARYGYLVRLAILPTR